MALTLVNDGLSYYICLSTDIVDNKITGASKIGQKVYVVDTGAWKIIASDLTLSDWNSGGGGTVTLGAGTASVGTVGINAGTNFVGYVAGSTVRVDSELTTTSSQATYGIGDAILAADGLPSTITNLSRINGSGGYLTGIRIVTNKKSLTNILRVHIYSDIASLSFATDNAAFKGVYADRNKKIGEVTFAALKTPTDSTNSDISYAEDFTVRIPFVTLANSRNLYWLLETTTALIPDNSQKFNLSVYAELN